jgi:hypothetical protein
MKEDIVLDAIKAKQALKYLPKNTVYHFISLAKIKNDDGSWDPGLIYQCVMGMIYVRKLEGQLDKFEWVDAPEVSEDDSPLTMNLSQLVRTASKALNKKEKNKEKPYFSAFITIKTKDSPIKILWNKVLMTVPGNSSDLLTHMEQLSQIKVEIARDMDKKGFALRDVSIIIE